MAVVEKVVNIIDGRKGPVNFEDKLSVARYYEDLALMQDKIKEAMEYAKEKLIGFAQDVPIVENKTKITYIAESDLEDCDVSGLFIDLQTKDRTSDFVKIASVTKTDVAKLADGNVLVAKYFKANGRTKAATIKYSSMTKQELKELAAKG